MNSTIREAILDVDFYQPCDGRGVGIDYLILNSDVLQAFSPAEIRAELGQLEAEGLLTRTRYDHMPADEFYWHSTTKGQIDHQRRLIAAGARSACYADQKKHALSDLILGALAAHKVSRRHHFPGIRRAALPIYFFEFSDADIEAAVGELLSQGWARSSDIGWGEKLHLTAQGLVHYKRFVHARLSLEEGQSVLDPRASDRDDPRFAQLTLEPGLTTNLQSRWREARASARAGAPLGTVILLGSVLEGLLFAVLSKQQAAAMMAPSAPREKDLAHPGKKRVRQLEDWTLQDMINVAGDLGMVTTAATKHAHELRDSRNLVHPRKQLAESAAVDEALLAISFEVVDAVLDNLVEYVAKTAGGGAP